MTIPLQVPEGEMDVKVIFPPALPWARIFPQTVREADVPKVKVLPAIVWSVVPLAIVSEELEFTITRPVAPTLRVPGPAMVTLPVSSSVPSMVKVLSIVIVFD